MPTTIIRDETVLDASFSKKLGWLVFPPHVRYLSKLMPEERELESGRLAIHFSPLETAIKSPNRWGISRHSLGHFLGGESGDFDTQPDN